MLLFPFTDREAEGEVLLHRSCLDIIKAYTLREQLSPSLFQQLQCLQSRALNGKKQVKGLCAVSWVKGCKNTGQTTAYDCV